MQAAAINNQIIRSARASEFCTTSDRNSDMVAGNNKEVSLKAAYQRLFKDNRDLAFHHNAALDSAYLNDQITTRDLVRELMCSDMYVNYILAVNSNYRFVELCFERVLGRKATQPEILTWSSFLATEGLQAFARKLTDSEEYIAAFGNYVVPYRRSLQLSTSDQGLPALPKEASSLRYTGPGNDLQYLLLSQSVLRWQGGSLPEPVRKIFAIVTIAGAVEVARVLAVIAWSAFSNGTL